MKYLNGKKFLTILTLFFPTHFDKILAFYLVFLISLSLWKQLGLFIQRIWDDKIELMKRTWLGEWSGEVEKKNLARPFFAHLN